MLHIVAHSLSLLNTTVAWLLPKCLFVWERKPPDRFCYSSTDVWEYILISKLGKKQGGVVFGVRSPVTFMWQVVEESCQFSTQSAYSVTVIALLVP